MCGEEFWGLLCNGAQETARNIYVAQHDDFINYEVNPLFDSTRYEDQFHSLSVITSSCLQYEALDILRQCLGILAFSLLTRFI